MKSDIDNMLRQALSPTEQPKNWLKQNIIEHVKETERMTNMKKRRISTIVLAAVLALSICSITVFAAWKFLSPEEVARHSELGEIAKAFESKDAIVINETQVFEDYKVTLLGVTAGHKIEKYMDPERIKEIGAASTYTVVAIERTDGKEMAGYTDSFFVSPLVQGLNPNLYNATTMGGGYFEFIQEGVLYRLAQCDDVEPFADKKLYLCVNSGTFFNKEGYQYNENSGEIIVTENFNGINALFDIPLDKTKADPKGAEEYLKKLEASWKSADEDYEETEVDIWMRNLTPENLEEYAERVEDSVMTAMPDEDNMIAYSYECGGGSGSGKVNLDVLFPHEKAGMCPQFSYSSDEGGLQGLIIQTFYLNSDGSVTYAVYVPKLKP